MVSHRAILVPELEQAEACMQFDKELDARGLNCPLPILRTKKALSDMASGEVLKITATDPGAVRDFHAFSKQTGNALLLSDSIDDAFIFFMQKK
jgi:tRNA 2-thiouridine synthesizing protein A